MLVESRAGGWYNMYNLALCLQREPWVEKVDIIDNIPSPDDKTYNCLIRDRIKVGHPLFEKLLCLPINEVCILSPLGRRYLGNKYWFVLFRDEIIGDLFRQELGDSDYKFILSYIPESGVLQANGLVAFTEKTCHVKSIDWREWMLKPPSGSSGKGIVIGRRNAKEWSRACLLPGNVGAIIQEFYNVRESVPVLNDKGECVEVTLYTKYGAFCFAGLYIGMEVMARESPLVHGARNTYLSVGVAEN